MQCVRGDGDGILKRCDVIWGGRISLLFYLQFVVRSNLLIHSSQKLLFGLLVIHQELPEVVPKINF